jgi:hypothetical protein
LGEQPFNAKQLLVLRKLTRAVVDALRDEAREYVAALTPLLRPRVALGDPADAGATEPFQSADRSFKELQALYEAVVPAAPFNLHKDLRPPVELSGASVELSPMEYRYAAKADGATKVLRVTSPLKWVLSYAGPVPGRLGQVSYAPQRLRDLLGGGSRSVEELRQFVLHYLALHLAVSRLPGVSKMLERLHFRLGSQRVDDFGPLPLPHLAFAVRTVRPPDDVLIEHTEIAGTDAFEEVIDVAAVHSLRDPTRERLVDLAKSHGL